MTTPDDAPTPPIPSTIDVRSFDCMPLDVVKLLNSDTLFTTTGEEFKAAVILWARAWHQVPAGSLPSNERHLAQMAGLGTDTRGWKRVREGALRGFILCSDGRYYHEVICREALKAFSKKTSGEAGADARWEEHRALKNKKTGYASASNPPRGKGDGKSDGTSAGTPHGKRMPRTEQNRIKKNPPSPQGGNAPVIEDVGKQEADPTPDPVELFETQFWKAYPQRAGANPKKPARDKFVALVKRGVDPAEIIAGARAYAADPETKIGTGYVATAVVWLNQERWKDAYSTGGPPTTTAENKALEAVPTLARGITPPLQIMMAKKYLMVWHQDGDKVVYVRAKHPNERKPWPYRNPETNEIWPLPGQPGCPVSPEAMRIAVAECRVLWPDNAPTLAEQARVDIEKVGPK